MPEPEQARRLAAIRSWAADPELPKGAWLNQADLHAVVTALDALVQAQHIVDLARAVIADFDAQVLAHPLLGVKPGEVDTPILAVLRAALDAQERVSGTVAPDLTELPPIESIGDCCLCGRQQQRLTLVVGGDICVDRQDCNAAYVALAGDAAQEAAGMSENATDRDIVRLARQIRRHTDAIAALFYVIRESDHPNAEALAEALEVNEIPPMAWATDAIRDYLLHPERYACAKGFTCMHKGEPGHENHV